MKITYTYIKLLFCEKSEKEFFFKIKHLLGFVPNKSYHFKKAFTHKSANCIENGKRFCNERLEFLGDVILDAIVAEYLYKKLPNESEGELTRIKSEIVNRKSLNKIALSLRLDKHIVCNLTNIENNDAVGNAFEAIIGAIYLDKGYNFTQKYVITEILTKHIDLDFVKRVDKNYKSQLMELIQRKKIEISMNSAIDESAINCTKFISTITYNDAVIATGEGSTKKDAEQQASKIAIQYLG